MKLTRLGPYQIDKPLGKGGMGSVYAATDSNTGQRVAIKALTPHLALAEGFRERFEAEIESLKTLRHEGIVRLYGYGEQDGILFYSMELVAGTSLEDELRAGRRFDWREVTNIAIQLALALKHAHDHGIIHRDIKPANILLYDDDRVKLADFGIARLFGTTQLTTAGGVLGTADYMSPEQADGRPVTARCDQYSLGGVMYALLTGRPPFVAKSLPQMLQLQRYAQPEPVRRYAPQTPLQLEQVILQLLAKEPDKRFPNMQVLARHLQAMVRALSRPAPDDFAIVGEPPMRPDEAAYPNSLALEPTQIESDVASTPSGSKSRSDKVAPSTQDALTMAAADVTPPPSVAEKPSRPATPAGNGAAQPLTERATRFTTLEEEEARRRAEQRRPWLVMAVQLIALLAALLSLALFVNYLMRPLTADELYGRIAARVESEDDPSLGAVAGDVETFLTRFPDDARAAELQRYKERIELDRLERQLARQARGSGASDPQLLPVEQLYLQAVNLTGSDPDEASTMLQSLVDLYGPSNSEDTDPQVAAVVQLAKRRLSTLTTDVANQREQQLATLRERLQTAAQLATTNPDAAAAMYQAILNLHEDDPWAAEIVTEARQALTHLK